jgi:hypothetical protein
MAKSNKNEEDEGHLRRRGSVIHSFSRSEKGHVKGGGRRAEE